MKKILASTVTLFLSVGLAYAAGSPSMAKGKELFKNATLGTSGKSCESCHPGGKGLEEAAGDDAKELAAIINACIGKALKGTPLAEDSLEMKSLVLYIQSFGKSSGK